MKDKLKIVFYLVVGFFSLPYYLWRDYKWKKSPEGKCCRCKYLIVLDKDIDQYACDKTKNRTFLMSYCGLFKEY